MRNSFIHCCLRLTVQLRTSAQSSASPFCACQAARQFTTTYWLSDRLSRLTAEVSRLRLTLRDIRLTAVGLAEWLQVLASHLQWRRLLRIDCARPQRDAVPGWVYFFFVHCSRARCILPPCVISGTARQACRCCVGASAVFLGLCRQLQTQRRWNAVASAQNLSD